jgi:hypothetical protein
MKIQSFKRIVKESFPDEQREFAGLIGDSVNVFAEEVLNAFNKKISVDDNLNMEYKEVEVTVDASGIPKNVLQYKVGLQGKVRGVMVVKVENLTNTNAYPVGAPFATFSTNNNVITVNHITGLIANNKYRLTLLSLG